MQNLKQKIRRFNIKNRLLIFGLTLPILCLVCLLFIMISPFSWPDLWLNIASDGLFLILTIWFVDRILKAHQERQWANAHKLISRQAGGIAHHLISVIAENIGLENELFPETEPPIHTRSIIAIESEIQEKARNLDTDDLIAKLDKLSSSQWKKLFLSLHKINNDLSTFLDQYGQQLSVQEFEELLIFQKGISSAISSYELFESFLGLSVDSMPKVKDGKPWEFAEIQTIRSGLELKFAMENALHLIRVFEYTIEEPTKDWNEEIKKHWNNYIIISRYRF